ncbi:MAG TPA: DinB family protein [Fimbriimonadaceae bacterium]|nr:DinB family protein [Fimbriimonadaceae bacterium]
MMVESDTLKRTWNQFFTTVHAEEGWITPLIPSLEGVEAPEAYWKPADGIPSIAEVLLHVDGWLAAVLRDLRQEAKVENEDWPAVTATDAAAWSALRDRIENRVAEAKAQLEGYSAEGLYQEGTCGEGSPASSLADIFVHNAYHTGQIMRTRQLYAAFQAQELVSA